MPVIIRTPGHDIFAGSYTFPTEKHVIEDYPWICRRKNDNTELCENCSTLNLDWLFSHSLYEHRATDGIYSANISDGICMGSYPEVVSRTCKLCGLLVHALNAGASYEMLLEKDKWVERDIYITNYAFSSSGIAMSPESKNGEYIMRVGVQLKSIGGSDSILSFGTRTVMIQKIVHTKTVPYGGIVVSSTTRDLADTIVSWLADCEETEPVSEDIEIRLIDTSRGCITEPTYFHAQNYAALSYTWGRIDPLILTSQNLDQLVLEGALDRFDYKLPRTIRDAIQLCKLIDQQYLWVDSLCIVQDSQEKFDQIRLMDRIYMQATFTVVAAAGGDGNAGLPGIGSARETKQNHVSVNELALANVLPHLNHSLAHSVWQSRGWTFQEGLLSPRKVIFTHDQVYYHCPHGECNEDTNSDLHQSSTALASRDIPLRFAFDNVSNWTLYRNVMAEYCKREFSYESDILDAFEGIAAYLGRNMFLNSAFLAGIPICSLAVGMLWHPTGRLRRRKIKNQETGHDMFPSWSWAGWDGPMEYVDAVDFDNLFERSLSCIEFPALEGEEASNLKNLPVHPDEWVRRVTGPMDEIYYTHENRPETLWFTHPIGGRRFPDGSKYHASYTLGPIQVFADIAELNLTGGHADLWFRSEECDEGDHQMCRLQVSDSQGRKAGIVVMDGATFDSTDFSHSLFTFVKINQTTLAPGRDDPAWDDETKSYAGKPGEPSQNPRPLFDSEEEEFDQTVYDPNICWCLYNVLVVRFDEEGIAERIAVGYVHIHAFDNAGPTRRDFLLG